MNRGPLLFLGILFALALSFWGLIVVPQRQIGQQQQRTVDTISGQQYPVARGGMADAGAEVYRANGCVECHTQQVRPESQGSDIARGWGKRRTVAQDYLRDWPVLLGNLRLGPDLANVGSRRPDRTWHLQHFYNPRLTSPGSIMAPYRYLYERRRLGEGEAPSSKALPPETDPGYEVVARPAAEALTAYMLSLRVDTSLPEAPLPAAPTNEAPTSVDGTNAAPVAPGTSNAAPTAATNTVTNLPAAPAP